MKILEDIQRAVSGSQVIAYGHRLDQMDFDMITTIELGKKTNQSDLEHLSKISSMKRLRVLKINYLPYGCNKDLVDRLLDIETPRLMAIRLGSDGLKLTSNQIEALLTKRRLRKLAAIVVMNNPSMNNKLIRIVKRRNRGKLRLLNLTNTGVTNKGVDTAFANERWPRLLSLSIRNEGLVNNDTIECLKASSMPELERLDLGQCAVTADAMASLLESGSMPRLKQVSIHHGFGANINEEERRLSELLRDAGLLRSENFIMNPLARGRGLR